jgi:sigma-B regulation protein RsbU (phosphoserine phosphatase)
MSLFKKMKAIWSKFTVRVIVGIIILLLVSSTSIIMIGYNAFTDSLTKQYNDSAYRTALTADEYVDGDKIDYYLQSANRIEYDIIWSDINSLCQTQDVTLIYVIKVNTVDYNSYVSVFNTVNDDSGYTPWPVGYERTTTNEEYRSIYKAMYEDGLERGTVTRVDDLNGRMPHITSLIPIKNSLGETTSILCVERPMDELQSGRDEYMKNVVLTSAVIAFLACVIVAIYAETQILTQFKRISDKAKTFASDESKALNISQNDMSSIKEIQELGDSIRKMEYDTISYMEKLSSAITEREHLNAELTLAANIQMSALPSTFPAFPDRKDFDIFASMKPAKNIGGDFYDFFLIDEDHIGLVMADVSGKGIPAALFMMMSKILLNVHVMGGATPKQTAEYLNNIICQDNKVDMFVTLWFGIMECSTGKVVSVNAGHEHPAIRRAGGRFELLKGKSNFVIGGLPDMVYEGYEFVLNDGDSLFLYTDGVPEATDRNNSAFGLDRMIDALNIGGDADPKTLITNVENMISGFVGDAAQFDDITMLSIKRPSKKANQ